MRRKKHEEHRGLSEKKKKQKKKKRITVIGGLVREREESIIYYQFRYLSFLYFPFSHDPLPLSLDNLACFHWDIGIYTRNNRKIFPLGRVPLFEGVPGVAAH